MARRSISEHGPLLVTIGVFAALLLPALFMDGMFMDGVFYASISRNFAEGYGTLWDMRFSDTFFYSMHEQPPLMFVLEGALFRLFGNTIYTERIYCVLAAIANSIVLIQCWRIWRSSSPREPDTVWLPLFLWIIMPVTFYAFTNNLEECTMTFFVLLALRSILKALFVSPVRNLHWLMAGLWLLAAGLTKGIQGMFLLSAPFWAWVFLKNGTGLTLLKRSALIAAIPIVFVIIAWITPVMHESFDAYFTSRFGKTFAGITANTTSRLHILFELLIDTLPVVAVVALLLFAGRKTPGLRTAFHQNTRMMFFLLACGFSGILPLMITLEQRGFYLVTALPIIAMACAIPVLPVAARLTHFLTTHKTVKVVVTAFGALVIAGSLVATFVLAGQPKRDADKIAALHEIAQLTGDHLTIRSTNALNADWGFLTYGQRYHYLSFTEQDRPELQWYITEKGFIPEGNYQEVPLKTQVYSLFSRQ